jgi:hypothetical protein
VATQVESRAVEENIRLLDKFKDVKIESQADCFDECDEDLKCTAACFKIPNKCTLHKFGFEKVTTNSSGWSSYIKPEVVAEIAVLHKLNETFPLIRQQTRLFGHYQSFNTLSPSRCFAVCQQSSRCAAASFTIDTDWLYNCYLFKAGQYTASRDVSDPDVKADMWTSFLIKPTVLIKPTTTHSTPCPISNPRLSQKC